MEPVGLAVGIAGLAGLFTTCVECFNIVQQGRYFGRDCWILETKYANQRLRLQTWGRACGFADASLRTNLPWDGDVRLAVEATLQRMAGLFQDHKTLHRRYGVLMVQPESGKTPASGMLGALASRVQTRASNLIRAHTGVDPTHWSSFSRRPALPTAARWAIVDKRKFADLVQHMKDFNDDLEALTTELNVRQRQRDLIREEVGSIIDVEELETIEVARMGITDPVADAASLRLCQIQERETRPADPPERDETISPEVPSGTPPPASLTGAEWEILDQPVSSGNVDSAEPVSYQVLHKVLCDSQPTTIFFDEPSYRTTSGTNHQWLVVDECNPLRNPAPLHLAGKRELSSLDSYLEQNSHLDFVLFKEYTCSHDTTTPRTAVSTESSIYLVSDALCSSLKSLNLEADPPLFCPTLELRSPYEWVYHNDELIKRLWLRKLKGKEDVHLLRAAEGLLTCIRRWMGNVYQGIDEYRAVSWERLPLIFPPGGLVIERNSEGEDDDRAFTQVGPVRFTRTTDEKSSEILEITVTARLNQWNSQPLLFGPHLREIRKLHIPRSCFDNSEQEARIHHLPIYPHKLADDDEQKYLAQRGLKYESLACGSHWVTYQLESETGVADGLDQYIVDAAQYKLLHQTPFTSETERQMDFETRDDHQDWWLWTKSERESYLDGMHEAEAMEGDLEKEGWEEGEEWPARRAFFTCQPHVIHGFRLRDHTWKKLLVRHIRLVKQKWGPWQDMVVGESEKRILERLLTQTVNGWSETTFGREKPARVFMTVRGPAGKEAMDAVSTMTRGPLYRVLISAETQAGFGERVLQQIAPIASRWKFVVVIEDLLGVCYSQDRRPESANATLDPLLRFLDTFKGVVILSLPDRDVHVHPGIEQRVCANLRFEFRDGTPDCRRILWRQYIKKCTGHKDREGDLSSEEEKYIDELAMLELSWDAIRSLVDAVTRRVPFRPGDNIWDSVYEINWGLLVELAEKKARRWSTP